MTPPRELPRLVELLAGAALLLGVALLPTPALAMGFEQARTLLTRSGFGASASEIAAFSRLTRSQAVARLLRASRERAVTPPPAWVNEFDSPRGLSKAARRQWARRQRERIHALQAWWLQEMLETPSPLTERMTVFWHSHFGTSARKVRSANLMFGQNVTLRRHALGRFDALLHAMAEDPALLFYLDAHGNRAGQPNENFARELMELFTLGEGRYEQADVREAARAFTGIAIDPRSGGINERRRWHDAGEKSVLGHTGRFGHRDIVELLLRHPATAEHIVSKLWREFVSPHPDPVRVRDIATRFRDAGYDIKEALRLLLSADALYAPAQRGALVKSPLDITVGTLRTLLPLPVAMPPEVLRGIALVTARLGQALFIPPSVKGWDGGEAWVDAGTLMARRQFLERVADRVGEGATMMSSSAIADPAALAALLLPVPPVHTAPRPGHAGDTLRGLLLDPAFQLR
jgi:uncharacterized protein (DUF1800 family)